MLSLRVRRAGAADAHRHRQRRCRTRLGRAPLKLRVCVPLKRIVRGARCGRGGGGAGTSARERDGARRGGGREQGTSRDFVDAGGSNYRFFREKIWSANRFLGFRLGAWQTFPFRSHVQVCFRQRLQSVSLFSPHPKRFLPPFFLPEYDDPSRPTSRRERAVMAV